MAVLPAPQAAPFAEDGGTDPAVACAIASRAQMMTVAWFAPPENSPATKRRFRVTSLALHVNCVWDSDPD